MKEEKLDIFNQNGEKTGESETYEYAHLNGLLHRTVHVWLVNSQKQILLQKRSKNKRLSRLLGYFSCGAY